MKFLMVYWGSNENARAVTERFMEWKPKGKWKTLYPISTMIGRNRGFQVIEADDLAEVNKDLSAWSDLCTFDCIPIMGSVDSVKTN